MFWVIVPLLILTGNAAAESYVSTHIGGNDAKVETKITTTVNGKTSTVQSNQPGTLQVIATDESATAQASPSLTPTITSGFNQAIAKAQNFNSLIMKVSELFQNLFKRFGFSWPFGS